MANLRFCSRDATTMEVSVVVVGCRRTIRFSSVYLPYENPDPPLAMMRDNIQNSAQEKKEIILGIDANAHHTFWGGTDINPRGESLMGYVVNTKLNILNKGNEPTFLNVKPPIHVRTICANSVFVKTVPPCMGLFEWLCKLYE